MHTRVQAQRRRMCCYLVVGGRRGHRPLGWLRRTGGREELGHARRPPVDVIQRLQLRLPSHSRRSGACTTRMWTHMHRNCAAAQASAGSRSPWLCCPVRWASEPACAVRLETVWRQAALPAGARPLPPAPDARFLLAPLACQLTSLHQPGRRAPSLAKPLGDAPWWSPAGAGLDWRLSAPIGSTRLQTQFSVRSANDIIVAL